MTYTPATAQFSSVHPLGKEDTSFEENKLQTWWDLDSKATLPFPQNPALVLEYHMWMMRVSTKENVYCLREEGNQ